MRWRICQVPKSGTLGHTREDVCPVVRGGTVEEFFKEGGEDGDALLVCSCEWAAVARLVEARRPDDGSVLIP